MRPTSREDIDYSRFHLWRDGGKPGALHVRPLERLDAFAIVRAEVEVNAPLSFEHSAGHTPEDLVSTEWAALLLISTRVVKTLRANGFTGWRTYPATLSGASGELIEGYSVLAVTGRSGPIDDSLSERVILPAPRGGRTSSGWRGLYFGSSTWDGSHIFVPGSSGFILITEPVKKAFEDANLSNMEFKSLPTIERLMI